MVVLVISGLINLSLSGLGEGVRMQVILELRAKFTSSDASSVCEQNYQNIFVFPVEGRKTLNFDLVRDL